jgi:UMF1 family MFS transporter
MTAPPAPKRPRVATNRTGLAAWALFDWANSPYGTVIETFIFSVYFAAAIYGDQVAGGAVWAYVAAGAGLAIAVLSPVLGAIADRTGRLKPWLAALVGITALATLALWFARPEEGYVIFALIFVAISTVGFELSLVFYNAMLPAIAPPGYLGRISGWAWGLGYFGGLAALALSLVGLVGLDNQGGFFGVPTEDSQHLRATALLVGVWMIVFAIPLFLLTPDTPATGVTARQAVRSGLAQLKRTLSQIRRYKMIVRFLIASALYRDGLATLFAIGGLYAAATMGMSFQEILIFAIGLNVTAGLGAAAMAYLDDYAGSRTTILLAIAGLIAFGAPLILVTDIWWFIALALGLGLFIGPTQAASRSLMARLAPPGMVTEMFGLYSLAGRSIAFIGPLMFGLVSDITGSQRAGLMVILVLFLAGGALLFAVREPPHGEEVGEAATPNRP